MCPKARKAAADAAAASTEAPATEPVRLPVGAPGPVPVPVALVPVTSAGPSCADCADLSNPVRTPIDAALRVAAPVGD
jgi:hypothetical protein